MEKKLKYTRKINESLNLYEIPPREFEIPVTSVKGKCPRPLDDGGKWERPSLLFIIKRGFYKCQLIFYCLAKNRFFLEKTN